MIAPEESVVTVSCRRSLLTVVSMWLSLLTALL